MKISNFTRRYANLTAPFRGLLLASTMLIALSVASCKSQGQLTRSVINTDSLQSRSGFALLQEPVSPSMVKTVFPMGMLKQIPVGTGFSKRSGQATVNVIRMPGDSIEVIATCDSLARQLILLTEELTRIRNDTQEEVEELPPEVIKEPAGFQWFQIWIGRVAVVVLILWVIKRRLNRAKKNE